MSEELAERLKTFCRLTLVLGTLALVYLYGLLRQARAPEDLPLKLDSLLPLLIVLVACVGLALLLSLYLTVFLGVDVLGMNRLFGMPRGRPFTGLRPDEEERLRIDFAVGGLNWANFNRIFKLRLTNQRLLVGANLTSWHLLELPLQEITAAEVRTHRWFGPKLHLERSGPAGLESWAVHLRNQSQFHQLVEELRAAGVAVQVKQGKLSGG